MNNSSAFVPIKWDKYFDEQFYTKQGTSIFVAENAKQKGPVVIALHGAGLAAVSFAHLAKYLKNRLTFVAFDFRGHGYSKIPAKNVDLSVDKLIKETLEVVMFTLEKYPRKSIILMGHSMGGAIASKTAKFLLDNLPQLASRLKGLILIDSLESIALESIPLMKKLLQSRSKAFYSV